MNELCGKLNKCCFLLSAIRDYVGIRNCISLYYAFFYSYLTYGIQAWGTMVNHANTDRLFKIQKKIIRIITYSKKTSPSAPLFNRLNLLTLKQTIDYWMCKLTFEYIHGDLPSTLNSYLNCKATRTTRRSNLPVIKKHKTQKCGTSFLVKSRSVWDSYRDELKHCKTKTQLKTAFKRKYIK